MKKRDSDKNPFEKKNLVKLAPAAVVIAAVAAAGAQAGSSGKEVTAETREVVKSQDLESLLKTAYSYEAADDEAEEESLLKAGKNTSSASSKKKTSKISKKKNGIKKGSSKTLPVKTAASSGVGQGSTTTPTTEVPEGGYKDGTYQGSGTGFGGTITVQVTVSGGKITAVDILSASGETGSYFASAQGVVSKVLSSQSPNVDAVSGATYSSNGIIQAVQNALSQAKEFSDVADITGIILTKMDGTAKGGIAVAIQAELGIPVKYIGVGETIDDLQKFDSDEFVQALFTTEEKKE